MQAHLRARCAPAGALSFVLAVTLAACGGGGGNPGDCIGSEIVCGAGATSTVNAPAVTGTTTTPTTSTPSTDSGTVGTTVPGTAPTTPTTGTPGSTTTATTTAR